MEGRERKPQRDVTEQFLSMSPGEFMEFITADDSDNYIAVNFSQLDSVKQNQITTLFNRDRLKKFVVYATEQQIADNPEFFKIKRFEVIKLNDQ